MVYFHQYLLNLYLIDKKLNVQHVVLILIDKLDVIQLIRIDHNNQQLNDLLIIINNNMKNQNLFD